MINVLFVESYSTNDAPKSGLDQPVKFWNI